MAKKEIKLPKSIMRGIRIPSVLWEKLRESAQENRRSINGELIVWLEDHKD